MRSEPQDAELFQCELCHDGLTGNRLLLLNDMEYRLLGGSPAGFTLQKNDGDGARYTIRLGWVRAGGPVWTCDCPDYTYRRKRALGLRCKHLLALDALGLIQLTPTT